MIGVIYNLAIIFKFYQINAVKNPNPKSQKIAAKHFQEYKILLISFC